VINIDLFTTNILLPQFFYVPHNLYVLFLMLFRTTKVIKARRISKRIKTMSFKKYNSTKIKFKLSKQ